MHTAVDDGPMGSSNEAGGVMVGHRRRHGEKDIVDSGMGVAGKQSLIVSVKTLWPKWYAAH